MRFTDRVQQWLDVGMGACHLRQPDVRAQIELCLLHFDGDHYDIDAFVLMPNHVHAVIKPAPGRELSRLLQAIKGVSANRCNKLLKCKSAFWMDESYDHIVRDAKELAAFRNYIAGNAAKAGLREGDVIQEVNKQPVKSAKDLVAISKKLKPNEKILMRVYSQGRSAYVALEAK